jgi:hypothetical protein
MAAPPTIGDMATTGIFRADIMGFSALIDNIGSMLSHGLEGPIIIPRNVGADSAAAISALGCAAVFPE